MISLQRLVSERSPRQVFCLSGRHLAVYEWWDGTLSEPLLFAPDREGQDRFVRYLEQTPPVPGCFLVDVVEEEYRRENLPHVFPRDRRALIRHRAARLFRDSEHWHAELQGRETEDRRDDRVLYVALTNPGVLEPWLALMTQRRLPIAGIFSLPLLSASLLRAVSGGTGNALLVSLQGADNLRQSFFQGRYLKISRLAHLPVAQGRQAAEAIPEEVEKLRHYLNSLRLLTRDESLDVYVLSDAEALSDLGRAPASAGHTRYHVVDIADLAHRLGMGNGLDSTYADSLFVRLLIRACPANHYATAQETRYFTVHRLRKAMVAASVALLLGSALWSGLQVVDGLSSRWQGLAAGQQAQYYLQRYREAKADLPPAPAEPGDLKAVVDTAATLAKRRAMPGSMMSLLGGALEAYPDLHLEEFEWRASADPDARVGDRSAVGGTGRAPAAGGNGEVYHLALIRGRLSPFDGDFRRALQRVQGFAEALGRVDGVHQVSVLSLPLNLSSQERLSGDVGASAAGKRADFTIKVVLGGDYDRA